MFSFIEWTVTRSSLNHNENMPYPVWESYTVPGVPHHLYFEKKNKKSTFALYSEMCWLKRNVFLQSIKHQSHSVYFILCKDHRGLNSWLTDQNNILTALNHNLKSVWPTKISMPLVSSLDNKMHTLFFKTCWNFEMHTKHQLILS